MFSSVCHIGPSIGLINALVGISTALHGIVKSLETIPWGTPCRPSIPPTVTLTLQCRRNVQGLALILIVWQSQFPSNSLNCTYNSLN